MVSVIIPAFNEEKVIGSTLESLVSQKTKKKFEVIVVDNNSTDKTASVVKSFSKKLNLVLVTEKRKGRGRARYEGFEKAKGDILFTTDADTILPENWIDELSEALKRKDCAAVTSPCDILEPSQTKRKIFNLSQRTGNTLYKVANGHYWTAGFSFAVTRENYEKVGKLNPHLKALDDIDIGKRLSKIGKIIYLPHVPVYTSNRRYQNGLVRGMVSYIKPFFQVYYLGKNIDMEDYR